MSNLRDKFKATKVAEIKKSIDTETAILGYNSGQEYLRLESGKTTKIRIYPKFPNETKYWQMRSYYWLPVVTSDGEIKRRPFSDARRHGGMEKDIVDEYIKFVKANFSDDEEKMEVFARQRDGLQIVNSWVAYASEVGEDDEPLHPKVWEFKKTVRDMLRNLACDEDGDSIIEDDPFTDPNDGLIVRVKYNNKPDKKRGENFYEVSLGKTPKKRPLTDEELEEFDKMTPLSELFEGYSIDDFEDALKSLQTFDEEEGIEAFDMPEWLDVVEEVRSQFKSTSKKAKKDEDEDEEKPAKKASKKSEVKSKPEPKPEPEDDDEDDEDEDEDAEDDDDNGNYDKYDDMSREELKRHIKSSGLEISVKKSMSDDDIRQAIRQAEATPADDVEGDDEEDEDEEEQKPAPKAEPAPKAGRKFSADEIKAKLAAKKK